MQTSICSTP